MTERWLLATCREHADDDAPRHVLADFYETRGDVARAEFVRVQLQLEPVRGQREIPWVYALHARERELLRPVQDAVFQQIDSIVGGVRRLHDVRILFRRGVPELLSVPAATFVAHGAAIHRAFPTLRGLALHAMYNYSQTLAASPSLSAFDHVELACWYDDHDAEVLAAAEPLRQVSTLTLWLGRVSSPDDALIDLFAQAAAEGAAWERVDLLGLTEPPTPTAVERFNRRARRDVARGVQGFPERYSLHPQIRRGLFPGRLPDGRMCLAAAIRDNLVELVTFDADGAQLPYVHRVEIDGWSALDFHRYDDTRRRLAETFGFEPAFIRVQSLAFPSDPDGYRSPYWRDEPDDQGLPDDHIGRDYDVGPGGTGSTLFWNMRRGEYVIHWEHWADEEGEIHST